jgi:phosphoribosylformimino-5-aminoimidazole carboxamide ribotide isomerase
MFVKQMASKYPIAVGIDAKDGYVAVEGWAEVSSMKATVLAKKFANAGVEAIICTDISKDGMLCGVNVSFAQSIALASGIDTIASGGVKDISDIEACRNNGHISGVIVGKAFYEGTINLEELFVTL